ncbi:ovarian cancer G-protein coupled receptor 1-like [Myripristis murdjan]|uniref:ovarian cancer G-protein coupled receptor 1-like n=1 Tax=Myripristis murdjan TaxID=586833 RepID=UPI0011760EBD|nr:ovarian cancer G-protein coupled receptor 1-like [Myripristis murdjan]
MEGAYNTSNDTASYTTFTTTSFTSSEPDDYSSNHTASYTTFNTTSFTSSEPDDYSSNHTASYTTFNTTSFTSSEPDDYSSNHTASYTTFNTTPFYYNDFTTTFDDNYWPQIYLSYEPDRYLSEAVLEASWIVISISVPLILVAIRALYSLVRDNHVVPVYVINLLVSDLIQMCCFVILLAAPQHLILTSTRLYYAGLMASVGFMVCVAMERYLLIAWPVWYRLRRNVKVSLVVCFMVWVIPSVYFILLFCIKDSVTQDILLSSYVLLPFPLLIFFLAGSLKALSSSISVSPEEKRLIVGTLVLVLLNYALFLPSIILLLYMSVMKCSNAPFILLQFSPFLDLVLYVFMMKGAVDKLLAYLCRCRMTTEQEQGQIPTVDSNTPQIPTLTISLPEGCTPS